MSGEVDPLYVAARSALLDTLVAVANHVGAFVLVGAQAVYHFTGASELLVAEFTTDADFSIDPGLLTSDPLLGGLMLAGGFTRTDNIGRWCSPTGVFVDLMVPERVAGKGTRRARLGNHGKEIARRAKGLEGSLIDKERATITAFDPSDSRTASLWIAGPGALIVAKTHKIYERLGYPGRLNDKDALDTFRLLQITSTNDLRERMSLLRGSEVSRAVTEEAISLFPEIFGSLQSPGVQMAVRASGVTSDTDTDTIAASMVELIHDAVVSLGS
jgi:hypothetical protein